MVKWKYRYMRPQIIRLIGLFKPQGKIIYLLVVILCTHMNLQCHAQSEPTADRKVMLSFFAGGTGSFTGIQDVKNYGLTVGVDARLASFAGIRPAVELRGFYPFDSGALVSHRDILAGVRAEKPIGRILPYADFLVGRSSLHYNPYLSNPAGTFAYTQSSSNIYSPGAGMEYSLSPNFALKADAQFQRFSTPVTESGHAYVTSITLGITYHLFGGESPH